MTDIRVAVISSAGVMAAMREESFIASIVERFEEVFNESGNVPATVMVEKAVDYLHKSVMHPRAPNPEFEPANQWLGMIGVSADFDVFSMTALYVAMRTTEGLTDRLMEANSILIVPIVEHGQLSVAVMPCDSDEQYEAMVQVASDTAAVGHHSGTVH